MAFEVVSPPESDEQLAEQGKEIIEAADRMGLTLDVQGFLYAWVGGTRVVVHRDSEGKIDTIAMMALGKRWLHNDTTASILDIRGKDTEGLIEFCKTLAKFAGAECIFIEQETKEVLDDREIYTVHKLIL